jgi:hypothetical protein
VKRAKVGMSSITKCSDRKNQAPEFLPRPDLYGAGYVRPLRSRYIVTMYGAVVLPRARSSCGAARPVSALARWTSDIGPVRLATISGPLWAMI